MAAAPRPTSTRGSVRQTVCTPLVMEVDSKGRFSITGCADDDIEVAITNLFRAYDLDESGELSRDEFLKIEMRMAFERGKVFSEAAAGPSFSLMDEDGSGTIEFTEFRERQLSNYSMSGMSKAEIVADIKTNTKVALTERVKMGPRYHAGIRQVLKRIFNLFDVSGDGHLSPEEWIAAQKFVALEITDDLDESWVDEGVKARSEVIHQSLLRVSSVFEQARCFLDTQPLSILVQEADKPPFRPPSISWQDEPQEEDFHPREYGWKEGGIVRLPLRLQTVEEISAVLRLNLQLPQDTWMSIFFVGIEHGHGEGGTPPVTLLRGERAGHGNVQSTLEWLAKPNAVHRLYVKNLRKRPTKLFRQSVAFLEDREILLTRRTGQMLGFDWETQLLGHEQKLPPGVVDLAVGDGLVIEVPKTDQSGDFSYVCRCFMDGTNVLGRPVEETIVASRKKKKGRQTTEADDPPQQLLFIALQTGKCILFVDLSWEDQEEKLAKQYRTAAPTGENSIARIGPIEVQVGGDSATPNRGRASTKSTTKASSSILWWNGEKWSNKKGPAKRKGKR